MHPNCQHYLRSRTLFWQKHFKPETKSMKIVPPKFCENCGTHFRQIKKNENFEGKYKKGEMIFYHGKINHFPCTLGLTVRNYSNHHMIKAVLKKARTKMVLSVPECAVRRKEEDESTVLPQKYNDQKKTAYPAIVVPQLGAVKTKSSNFKVDVSTQTKSEQKKRTLSKIRSEFSECFYPFMQVENWVNGCPSQFSDVSPHSEEVPDQQKTASHVSEDVPEVPDNCMDIPEQWTAPPGLPSPPGTSTSVSTTVPGTPELRGGTLPACTSMLPMRTSSAAFLTSTS